MTTTFAENVTMVKEECCSCGVVFALTQFLQAQLRESHKSFFCPNGHSQSYTSESESQRLKRMLEREQRDAASSRENLVAARRAQERAEKSLQRLKKRTAAGVCPCCNRTVAQLKNHMQSKHKQFLQLNGIGPAKQLPENAA